MSDRTAEHSMVDPENWCPVCAHPRGACACNQNPLSSKPMNYTQAFEAWWQPHWGNLGAKRPEAADAFRAGWDAARRAGETLDVDQAFEAGWRVASDWADREDLLHDIGSAAYHADMTKALKSISRPAEKATEWCQCPGVCAVCGGRSMTCAILGHRSEADRQRKWHECPPMKAKGGCMACGGLGYIDEPGNPCNCTAVKTDAKQDCVCKDYCERDGRRFPEHWEWRCKGLPVPRGESL